MRELAALRMVWACRALGPSAARVTCVFRLPPVFLNGSKTPGRVTGSSRTHTRQTHEPHKPNHLKINPIRTYSRARPHPITAAVLGFLPDCRGIVFLLWGWLYCPCSACPRR